MSLSGLAGYWFGYISLLEEVIGVGGTPPDADPDPDPTGFAVSRPEKKERMVLTDLMETPRRRTEPTEGAWWVSLLLVLELALG
jgi:hypothetical protein